MTCALRARVCAYVHACLRACTHTCIRTCKHACVRECVRACASACVRPCARACSYACARACLRPCMYFIPRRERLAPLPGIFISMFCLTLMVECGCYYTFTRACHGCGCTAACRHRHVMGDSIIRICDIGFWRFSQAESVAAKRAAFCSSNMWSRWDGTFRDRAPCAH